MFFLGLFEGHADPAACLVRDGKVIAYAEEERFLRNKHAFGLYPINAIKYCLNCVDISLSDISAVGIHWDIASFDNGTIASYFDELNSLFDVDEGTSRWQQSMLSSFTSKAVFNRHHFHWTKHFGSIDFPPIVGIPHHYAHAFQACFQSPFSSATCIVMDGSGDVDCTSIWKYENNAITKLFSRKIPHSLGWFYAAFTEFLGFEAYDGEYKVMGLASYGNCNENVRSKLNAILSPCDSNLYSLDPKYIHYGPHTYSKRFTDHLVELMGIQPRTPDQSLSQIHKDIAYEVQYLLESVVTHISDYAIQLTGIDNLCIGGGVGLNIKMNSALHRSTLVSDFFAHPLCSDGGAAQAAALVLGHRDNGNEVERLSTLALGPEYSDESIRKALDICKLPYQLSNNISLTAAQFISGGMVVGWFQGRMEAGPRALGQRSILADPRCVSSRDKVNAVIKFREDWRPFCPSIAEEFLDEYFDNYYNSPFMNNSFFATQKLKEIAPAIVHVDGTSRIQAVSKIHNPLYHSLLMSMNSIADLPILLNTSFNVKGEPIVMSPVDALRTFSASGMDCLCIGNYFLLKNHNISQNG